METRNWNKTTGTGWKKDPKDNLWHQYKNFKKTGKTQKNVIIGNPFKAVAHEGTKLKKLYIKNQEEYKKKVQAKKDAGYVIVRGRWKKKKNYGNKDKVEVKENNNNNSKVNKEKTNNNESKTNKTVVKEETNNNGNNKENKNENKTKNNNNEVKTNNNNENKTKVNKEVKKTPRFIRDTKRSGRLVSTSSVKGKQMLKVQERKRKLKEKRFGKK